MARFGALVLLLCLAALPRPAHASRGSVTLQWTAPGDDGLVGEAAIYDVRYSTVPITDATFRLAKRALMKRAGRPGTHERCKVENLVPGMDYYFAIKTSDADGNWSGLSNLARFRSRAVASEPRSDSLDAIPAPPSQPPVLTEIGFSSPMPNPARAGVHFFITLPRAAMVRVEVFDATGRRVRNLVGSMQPAGRNRLDWDLVDATGHSIGPGVYLVRAEMDGFAELRRLVVVR